MALRTRESEPTAICIFLSRLRDLEPNGYFERDDWSGCTGAALREDREVDQEDKREP